jgi:hypothetical protein
MTSVIKPCCVLILDTVAQFREARVVDIPDALKVTLAGVRVDPESALTPKTQSYSP